MGFYQARILEWFACQKLFTKHIEVKSNSEEVRRSGCSLGISWGLILLIKDPFLSPGSSLKVHSLAPVFVCSFTILFICALMHLLNIYFVPAVFYDWKCNIELYMETSESAWLMETGRETCTRQG